MTYELTTISKLKDIFKPFVYGPPPGDFGESKADRVERTRPYEQREENRRLILKFINTYGNLLHEDLYITKDTLIGLATGLLSQSPTPFTEEQLTDLNTMAEAILISKNQALDREDSIPSVYIEHIISTSRGAPAVTEYMVKTLLEQGAGNGQYNADSIIGIIAAAKHIPASQGASSAEVTGLPETAYMNLLPFNAIPIRSIILGISRDNSPDTAATAAGATPALRTESPGRS